VWGWGGGGGEYVDVCGGTVSVHVILHNMLVKICCQPKPDSQLTESDHSAQI